MPWLEDTDNRVEVYESRAIIKCESAGQCMASPPFPLLVVASDAAAKFGSALLPVASDLKAYADFEQACSIELCDFDESARTILGELVGAKMWGHATSLTHSRLGSPSFTVPVLPFTPAGLLGCLCNS
jgi:hypothetical protein